MKKLKYLVEDETRTEIDPVFLHLQKQHERPPDELGRNLTSVELAKQWLLFPGHWRDTKLYILIWDGLIPYISRSHAERLLREPWDMGIFEVAVRHQFSLKHRVKRGENINEFEVTEE